MPKFIVRPGQKVTHGSHEDAQKHYSKMQPGQSWAAFPPAPVTDYFEGDELELTEEEAAAMPHAVTSPEDYAKESSPEAFMKKGYTRDEAESMVASAKDAREQRKKQGAAKKTERAAAWGMSPPNLEDQGAEINPRAAAKFPEDDKNKSRK